MPRNWKMKVLDTLLWLLLMMLLSARLCWCDDLSDFVGLDDDFAILEAWEDVTAYFEPMALIESVPFDAEKYNSLSEEDIDAELWDLYGKLEQVYDTLVVFAKVLASLTADDLMEMAEKLENDQELYARLVNEPSHKIMRKLFHIQGVDDTAFLEEHDQELMGIPNDPSFQPMEPLVYDYDDDYDDDDDSIWSPDTDYEMIAKLVKDDPDDMDAVEKMGVILLAKKIIKKIKRIIKKVKKKAMLIIKLIKLKKLIKKTRVIICIKIMLLIEKIKRMVKLIIKLIKKLIVWAIKELPFEILWKIKIIIKLLIKVLLDILWEIEIIVLEILVKVAMLLKKMKRAPIEIIVYFKTCLLDMLGLADDDSDSYWNFDDDDDDDDTFYVQYFLKAWPATDESDFLSQSVWKSQDVPDEFDGVPDLVYLESDEIVVPQEFYEIFRSALTVEEIDDVLKGDDSFNFDVEFPEIARI